MNNLILDNCFIFVPEQNEIISIEYNTAHPFYYWARYITCLITNTTEKYFNFLFVLEEDVRNPDFYKALYKYFINYYNRIPLISIGVFALDDVDTFLPVHYLDSSIWNYYINIEHDFSILTHPNFLAKLDNNVINIINSNQGNLYNLTVAKEFIEFQSRLLGNSYLGLPGGHSSAVVPFVFHSEQNMKKKSETVLKGIGKLLKKQSGEINIKWNVLLIDDYAEKNLKGSVNKKDSANNKKEIFEKVSTGLKNIILKVLENTNFGFDTIGSYSIEDAIKKIKTGKIQYDIILLDYLLGSKSGENNTREYGDEFLHELERNEELLKRKGPLGKFWIFPISSFSNAMLSKLEEAGIGRINNNWYIMDGADMINTPELFKYNFLQLIYLQLNSAIVTIEDIVKFVMENKTDEAEGNPSKDDIDDEIYPIRQNARRLYGIFMHRFGLRGVLKNDAKQGSAFAQSVLEYMDNEKPDALKFYESVRKLLYLVGYGTHADAALMWDLLTYIDTIVESVIVSNDVKDKNKVRIFIKSIRKYITILKNNHG